MDLRYQPNDHPLSWEELRRRPAQEPTADVPEELQAIGRVPGPPHPKEIQFLERSASVDAEPLELPGLRPDWVGESVLPERVKFPQPPPRVQHRGVELDPLSIFEPDDRKIYFDTNVPWGCVCRITNAAGRIGSGVLIGARHVLTASHVVEWSPRPELIEVLFAGTTSRASAFDTNAIAFTHISGDPTSSTVDEDYAVLVTNERLGERFGALGVKTYDSAWDGDDVWTTMGYPGDPPRFNSTQPTFQKQKALDEDAWDLGSGRA